MAKYLLIIKADTNDADYVHRVKEIDTEKDKYPFNLERLNKITKIIKEEDHHYNWGKGEVKEEDPRELYKDKLTEEEIDWFDHLCPRGEYGIHTIESIELYEISSKETLL